jgi:hypothetical protein
MKLNIQQKIKMSSYKIKRYKKKSHLIKLITGIINTLCISLALIMRGYFELNRSLRCLIYI